MCWFSVSRLLFGRKKSLLEYAHLFPPTEIAFSKFEVSVYERLYKLIRGEMDER